MQAYWTSDLHFCFALSVALHDVICRANDNTPGFVREENGNTKLESETDNTGNNAENA